MIDERRLSGRRRVVMLVDNTIDGDSRVQKAARSMAEAGWEVHLIGRAAGIKGDRYEFGGATVYRRTLKVPPARKMLRQRFARLRFPLAYANTDVAERHWNQRIVARTDLAQRRLAAALRAEGRSCPDRRLPTMIHRLLVRVRQRWLRGRLHQTRAAAEWQKARADGLPERIETAFWKALMGGRAWRRLDPMPLRYELSFAPLIDRLRPDLIHAHDYRMVGVGARAVARARAEGREVRMVYDAHEFLPGIAHPNRKWMASNKAYEREFVPYADAVVTVSPQLADLLVERHVLRERPWVVLNAAPRPPARPEERAASKGDGGVREVCGLGPETPLMVYCGGAAAQRCLHTMVDALRYAERVHAAFVVNNLNGPYVRSLKEQAQRHRVDDRVHFMPYVPHEELVEFLSTADVGVHPLRTGPINHEVALSTKFFEFMQARLPIAVSDVKAMSEQVRSLGVGEVFKSEDSRSLARAVEMVLADPARYTKRYTEPGFLDSLSWEGQAEQYDRLYRRLLSTPLPEQVPAGRRSVRT